GNAYDTNDKYEAGQVYGTVYRVLLGGHWNNAAVCGSRGSAWNDGALNLSAACGARGASEPFRKRVN
ncbi:MAG: hypothetical protein K6F62_01555, partial [Schwartzia sp.]|nr:hypothetical protein [Schwartzia sp. (in: firmicutes)]